MSKKSFIRKVEDFECEKCGFVVSGNGYTNHCPKCLYSKHVDIVPGDRAALCKGVMKPVSIFGTQKKYMITHVCLVCGYSKNNGVAEGDDFEAVLAVVKAKK